MADGIVGFVTAGIQLGVQSVQVRPQRSLGPFQAQVVISETHTDELEITDHPVETGARISDHAYMRPAEVVLELGWSNSVADYSLLGGVVGPIAGTLQALTSLIGGGSAGQVRDTYAKLLDLQRSRIPFDIQTGKRIYSDMLIKTLRTRTDKSSENSLIITAVCRQVLIASVQVVAVGAPQANQATPSSTTPTVEKGSVSLSSANSGAYNTNAGSLSQGAQTFAVANRSVTGVALALLGP